MTPTLLTILLMALATYATRAGGFALGAILPRQGRARAALDALPPAVLTALIAPAVVAGRAEMAGALVTALLALRLPVLPAMAGGIVTVAVIRALG
jgi:uncharacterized membrane protein